jgi:murein DD-endopeptidase MepM/ murein hydrolase activator NlpD
MSIPHAAFAGTSFLPDLSGQSISHNLSSGEIYPGEKSAGMGQSYGSEQVCAPGLTVAPTVTDRHALQDVGGRLDVTKGWRLTIPDPVNGSSQYRNMTDAKPVDAPTPASTADNVTPCLDHLPETAMSLEAGPAGRQLAFSRTSRLGGRLSPQWWASPSLTSSLPVSSFVVTSGFGMRFHPILHAVREHDGIDLAAPIGTPVFATQDGVVRMADRHGGYGLFVDLDNGSGLQTRYGHMSRLSVVAGQRVRKGQLIGSVGSTGLSTGPHLHYEVRLNGQAVNPLLQLRK